uniref:CRIB domain-containing protein n=1 Tax=Kwoniella bestiolae CBS 10118 TaxID=1296100 RepID=A0A1B9G693_9TREE|nr:hypothetical protein I302_04209 [Kwoniella bestiolae CBS 10118]OCF26523.1 hypothetical protein I302_04209 [Kwoniella bestiolae CBS 10118]
MLSSVSSSASSQPQGTPIRGEGSGGGGLGLGRKRSSGQLLMGIGKGLNRVGSVMRRSSENNENTSSSSSSSTSPNKKSGSTWRKGRRRKTNDWQDGWEKVNRAGGEADEGDAGIGRPFNVGHDLHVSPDLSDLPDQWLSSLKAQGLTESDLLLISAARKKQHETHRIPLPVKTTSKLPQAPLSAPPSRLLDAPFREIIAGPGSEDTHQTSSQGLLKKFSFEDRDGSPTTPTPTNTTGRMVEEPNQIDLDSPKHRDQQQIPPETDLLSISPSKQDRRRAIESFPVSAAGSSDLNHEHEDVFNPQRISTISSLPSERTDFTVPARRNKRFSSQLKGFRESTFGLGEEDEGEWGKSVLDSTWLTSAPGSGSLSNKGKGKMKVRDDKIPIPPELSVSPKPGTGTQIGHKTPPRQDSVEEMIMPKSPPPPARPRKQPSVTLRPSQDLPSAPMTNQGQGEKDIEDETRKSSESFGVHYNTAMSKSKSSVSVGSELITPSTSMEQGMDVRERNGNGSDEEGEYTPASPVRPDIPENKGEGQLITPEGLIRRYHSNPHISLPASAIHSRSTTPDLSLTHPSLQSGTGTSLVKPHLTHQQSYSTFDSTPYKILEEDDLMDGLDRANPEEGASIALSLLSSRTSTSMQSLNELSQATVRTAYKLPPVGEGASPVRTVNPMGHFTSNRDNDKSGTGPGAGSENENERSSGSGELKLIEESSECGGISLVSTSGWGSEENDNNYGTGAKDAMDALGEAARKLRSS